MRAGRAGTPDRSGEGTAAWTGDNRTGHGAAAQASGADARRTAEIRTAQAGAGPAPAATSASGEGRTGHTMPCRLPAGRGAGGDRGGRFLGQHGRADAGQSLPHGCGQEFDRACGARVARADYRRSGRIHQLRRRAARPLLLGARARPADRRGGALDAAQGTPLAGGIRRAGDIASADAEAVIVVVSDGDNSCGGDPCAEARAIKAKKPNVKINVIDLSGDAKSSAVMQCVAAATGGRVLKPNSAADLDTVMQRATEQADLRQCTP